MKQRGVRFDEQRALDRKKVSRRAAAPRTSDRFKDPLFIAQLESDLIKKIID